MTRSGRKDTLLYDPEIEKTAKSLRKQANLRNQASKPSSSTTPPHRPPTAPAEEISAPAETSITAPATAGFLPETEFLVMAENPAMAAPPAAHVEAENQARNVPIQAPQPRERTLGELAEPAGDQAPLCIEYPLLTAPFELRTGLIHLLPKFRGLENEDPHKHLKAFHVVCSTMRPQGIPEDDIKLRAFPFSLEDYAKEWLFYLPPGSITSWADMVRAFLRKFFPTSKAIGIRREISGIKQKHSEGLYEYWERFKKLCTSCPRHDISDQSLIEYFYGGLLPSERKFIDAACGGTIEKKSPREMRDLISSMAAASQQFGDQELPTRNVNEVSNSILSSQLSELTNAVRSLVVSQTQQVQQIQQPKTCGICANNHPTDLCPSLQEEDQQVNADGGFNGQRRYDPYSNTYNPGWRDHPNFSYARVNQYPN